MLAAYLVPRDQRHLLTLEQSSSHSAEAIPVLLSFLTEGGANVLYRMVSFPQIGPLELPAEAHNCLLRLRKTKGLESDVTSGHLAFSESAKGVFAANHLIPQSLVAVDPSLLSAINHHLLALETTSRRAVRRHGDTASMRETCALLVKDMGPFGSYLLIETKPKWLLQSPTAPSDARRCRTCALRAQRRRRGQPRPTSFVQSGSTYCPLALMSGSQDELERTAKAILLTNGHGPLVDHVPEFAEFLKSVVRPLLIPLRDQQRALDPSGVMGLSGSSSEETLQALSKAMTIRDCTLFISAQSLTFDLATTEVRFADFDYKEPHARIEKWMDIERSLINEGWYTCLEIDHEPEMICLLRT